MTRLPPRPKGVPPPYDTRWSHEYDERTAEVVEAKAKHDAEDWPELWPISGPDAVRWVPKTAWWKISPES